jgi:hypothetical protein
VQKYSSKPFVLLGVNSDPREKLKKIISEGKVTWRSFWDGGDYDGPIARSWNISGWPASYLIDRKGIIRFKGHDEDCSNVLTSLLEEKP